VKSVAGGRGPHGNGGVAAYLRARLPALPVPLPGGCLGAAMPADAEEEDFQRFLRRVDAVSKRAAGSGWPWGGGGRRRPGAPVLCR